MAVNWNEFEAVDGLPDEETDGSVTDWSQFEVDQPAEDKPLPSMRSYEPTFMEKVADLFGGKNKDRAYVEWKARQIAEDEGVDVNEVYKSAGSLNRESPLNISTAFNSGRSLIDPRGGGLIGSVMEGAEFADYNSKIEEKKAIDEGADANYDRNVGERALTAADVGWDNMVDSLSTTKFILSDGDAGSAAETISAALMRSQAFAKKQTTGERAIHAAAGTESTGLYEGIGVGLGTAKTYFSNPGDAAVFTAGQVPNSVPTYAAGAAGAVAGLPGGPGTAIAGGRTGMVLGTTAVEVGATVQEMVANELGPFDAPTKENVQKILEREGFMEEARATALKKGLTVAAVDQLFLMVGGKVAAAPSRKASKKAHESAYDAAIKAGKSADDAADAAIDAAKKAVVSKSSKIKSNAAAIGLDAAGETTGEAASQMAAYGEVDAGEAALEGLAGFPMSAADVAIGSTIEKIKDRGQNGPDGSSPGFDQQNTPPGVLFNPTHKAKGGKPVQQATKAGKPVPDTYVDEQGNVFRDPAAVAIPQPEIPGVGPLNAESSVESIKAETMGLPAPVIAVTPDGVAATQAEMDAARSAGIIGGAMAPPLTAPDGQIEYTAPDMSGMGRPERGTRGTGQFQNWKGNIPFEDQLTAEDSAMLTDLRGMVTVARNAGDKQAEAKAQAKVDNFLRNKLGGNDLSLAPLGSNMTPIDDRVQLDNAIEFDQGDSYMDLNLDLAEPNRNDGNEPPTPPPSGEKIGKIDDLRKAAAETTVDSVKRDLLRQADTLEQELKGEKPKLSAIERARKPYDSTADDLQTLIRKGGGLDTAIESDWAGRLKSGERKVFGLKSMERPGKPDTMTLDDLLERANQEGFNFKDKAELEEALDRVGMGEEVYSTNRSAGSMDYAALRDEEQRRESQPGLSEEEQAQTDFERSEAAFREQYELIMEPEGYKPSEKQIIGELAGRALDHSPGQTAWVLKQNMPDAEIKELLQDILANEPEPRQTASASTVFKQPYDHKVDKYNKMAKEEWLTERQRERFMPEDTRDDVTGMYKAEDRIPTMNRARDYVDANGTEGSYVDIDLRNLGGLNAEFSHTGANKHFKAFADIISKHVANVGNTVTFRHGGDEMSVIAPDVGVDDMTAAMAAAQDEINQYVQDNGLADLPHAKYEGASAELQEIAKGTGIYFGVSMIDTDVTNSEIIQLAEEQTEAKKPKKLMALMQEEKSDVNQQTTKATWTGQDEPGTGAERTGDPDTEGQGSRAGETTGAKSATEIAAAAAEATGHDASDAQINANNYKKGHLFNMQGFKISLENEAGTKRNKMTPKSWPPLAHHYGDLTGTTGADGDAIDVFIKQGADIAADHPIYVINQKNKDGSFDEVKVMMGFDSEADAKQGYLDSYSDDFTGFDGIVETAAAELREWADSGDMSQPFVSAADMVAAPATESGAQGNTGADAPRGTKEGLGNNLTEQSPEPESEIGSVDEIAQIVRGTKNHVFVRWSSSEDMEAGKVSRDYLSGEQHAGLSAIQLTPDMSEADIAKYIHEYGFLRVKDPSIRPRLYEGDIVGTDSDGYPSFKPARLVATLSDSFMNELDNKLAERLSIEEYIRDAERRLKNTSDPAGLEIIKKNLAKKKEQLTKLSPIPSRETSTEFALGQQTDADILADEAAQTEAQQQEQEADRKAEADAQVDDFTLAGSDSAVDQAEARGQQNMFDQKPVEADAVAILDSANVTGKDRLDIMAKYRLGEYTLDDLKAAYPATESRTDQEAATSDDAADKAAAAEKTPANQEKIDDVGEKIGGARKDVWTGFRDKANEDVSADDIRNLSLSKLFPEPDYAKLEAAGVDAQSLAVIKVLRDEIPRKPGRGGYKMNRYVEGVTMLMDASKEIMADPAYAERFIDGLRNDKNLYKLAARIDLMIELGFPQSNIDLKGIILEQRHYALYRGEENVTKWFVDVSPKSRKSFGGMGGIVAATETRAEAVQALKDFLEKQKTAPKRGTKFSIFKYRDQTSRGWIVGKKTGRNYIELKDGFKEAADARAYLDANQAELEQELKKRKEIPAHRRPVNEARVGDDYRGGRDVGTEEFQDAFSFFGVEFGNYVEQGKRQQDLNDAYDGLMDLAKLLDLPPEALSLNGELGLAFGARGKGGKDAPKAHYEKGRIVINLTKKDGAGSLAHEWFHGLDNYFSRMRGDKSGYMTERPYELQDKSVRKEVVDKFKGIMRAIQATDLPKRSKELDSLRSKPYWSTNLEMAARSFESYIIDKLGQLELSSDYLANIVSPEYWTAAEALGLEAENSYPYMLNDEQGKINTAFDDFFNTLETRKTDKGTQIYEDTGAYSGYERRPSNLQVRQPAPADYQQAQLDLFAPANIPAGAKTDQQRDNFKVRFEQVEVGTIRSGIDSIQSYEDAAHVIAPIRKHAQETMMAMVTDADGKIIHIIRHTKGQKDSSDVSPVELAAAIVSTEGAAGVWFAHNHPSGTTLPSQADRKITGALNDALEGSGVDVKGHVIVGDGMKFGRMDKEGNDQGSLKINPFVRRKEISVTERVLRKRNMKMADEISSPESARRIVGELGTKNGVILMDQRHRVIGVMASTVEEMSNLRGTKQIPRILKAIDSTNAAAVILVSEDAAASKNMGNYLSRLDGLRLLDAMIHEPDGSMQSVSEQGGGVGNSSDIFYSKRNHKPGQAGKAAGITEAEAVSAIEQFEKELGNPEAIDIVTAPTKESIMRPDALREVGNDQVKGYYVDRHEADGGGAIVLILEDLDSVTDAIETLRHEWVAHHGLNTFNAKDKHKIINRIMSSKSEMSLKKAWQHVKENYSEYPAEKQAEEMLAYMAENKTTRLSKLWNDLVLMVQNMLKKLGLMDKGRTTKADVIQFIEDLSARVGAGAKQQTFAGETSYSKQAVDVTETESFKRWFGDSKVVDKNGDPLVVYHGSPDARGLFNGSFKTLRERYGEEDSERAYHFTDVRSIARTYADDSRALDYQNADNAVGELYLSIKNPYIVDAKGKSWSDMGGPSSQSDVITQAKADGYDGVIIKNTIDDYQVKSKTRSNVYIAFEPAQIKSAQKGPVKIIHNGEDLEGTGPNIGTLDPNNADIMHSKRSAGKAVSAIDKRTKGAAATIKHFIRRNLTKEGLMPDSAFEHSIGMDSEKNVGESEISFMVAQFESAVANAYGKKYNKLTEAELESINSYLAGNDGSAIPDGLAQNIDHMRAYLDRLSAGMQEAMADMLKIEAAKLSEKEKYAFDQYASGAKDGYLPKSMAKHWNLYQTIEKNKGTYLTRSYQAFDNKKWKQRIMMKTSLIKRAEAFIAEQNPELTPDEVAGAVGAILEKAYENGNFMSFMASGSMLGSKDASITTKRKDVPPVIRELLGEYKDPKVNFVRSATKMQYFVGNHHFLMGLRNDGLGTWLFERPTGEYDAQIAGDASEAMNPLNGLYTSRDIKQGLIDASGVEPVGDIMRQLIRFNSVVKYGKAQPLESIIQTPDGPVLMGDLSVGDVICGAGAKTTVTGVYPQGELDVYRFRFNDGSTAEASDEHLWEVIVGNKTRVMTTNDILSMPAYRIAKRAIAIPVEKAIFDEQPVPIDPYMLGALLGDGGFSGAGLHFSNPEPEIIYRMRNTLPEGYVMESPPSWADIDYYIKAPTKEAAKNGGHAIKGPLERMGLWGKKSLSKFIPIIYMRNSEHVRMELMRGLLDTDGTVNRLGQPIFNTSSKQLADDVRFLAESLGASVMSGEKITASGNIGYELRLRVHDAKDWFWLPRKKNKASKRKKPLKRTIVSISYVGKKDCQCIMVDDPRNLYMTERFVVTHNTILAPTTQVRNFISAGLFTVMNGHFDYSHLKRAYGVAKSDLFTKDAEWKKYINKLVGLGVLHNNPHSGELRDAIDDFMNLDVYSKGWKQMPNKVLDFVQRTYQLGDDFWKVVGYENELQRQLDAGLSQAEAEKKAAYRIRNGYPTYSMVPRGVKKIRKWPLIGTFVSFPYEIIRTSYNQVGFLKEDYDAGNRKAANQRAAGISIAISAAYAASVVSMMLMGIDDDDDEAVRKLLPPWSGNSQLIYTGYDENGAPTYYDLSYIDPYTYLKKPISALMNGNNEGFDEKVMDAMSEFLDPFIGVDIAAGAALELASNKRLGTGSPIWNEQASPWDKAKAMVDHARKAVQPGVMSNIERIILAMNESTSRSGGKYELGDEIWALAGQRFGTLNIPQSMVYKSFQFSEDKAQSSMLLSHVSGSGEKISEGEMRDAVNKMLEARGRVYRNMIKIANAAKRLGVSDDDLADVMEASGISRDDTGYILDGEAAPWDMPFRYGEKAYTRAMLTAHDDARRAEIEAEMDRRLDIIDQVLDEHYMAPVNKGMRTIDGRIK